MKTTDVLRTTGNLIAGIDKRKAARQAASAAYAFADANSSLRVKAVARLIGFTLDTVGGSKDTQDAAIKPPASATSASFTDLLERADSR